MTEEPSRPNAAAGWLSRAVGKARHAAEVMKDEYVKGTVGDDSPVQAIGPSASHALKGWLAKLSGGAESAVDDTSPQDEAGEAAEVANLLKKVDWKQVSTSIKDSSTAQRMKDLSAQVDWEKAKPAAARVGTALIAAAASGQLGGLKGQAGARVAKTIIDQTGLADRVSRMVADDRSPASRPLQSYIDTTATESPAAAAPFNRNLAELEQALRQRG